MTNDRPDLSSEGEPDIDKTILVYVNRNKYPVVRPTWALKPGLTDRLVVGRNVTLTLTLTLLVSYVLVSQSRVYNIVAVFRVPSVKQVSSAEQLSREVEWRSRSRRGPALAASEYVPAGE
jgi:hypothetical protein